MGHALPAGRGAGPRADRKTAMGHALPAGGSAAGPRADRKTAPEADTAGRRRISWRRMMVPVNGKRPLGVGFRRVAAFAAEPA